jgi:HD-GYP domain-containing protein (c-di-GMP phosphodiesterase class II)
MSGVQENAFQVRNSGEAVEGPQAVSPVRPRRTPSARTGYIPVPLKHGLVRALASIPVYLRTTAAAVDRFTLYCADHVRFSQQHRARLISAGVRFVYVPIAYQVQLRRQVEQELVTLVADPVLSIATKAAMVYDAGVELVDELLAEQRLAEFRPRLEQVSRAVATLVLRQGPAFAHLFATAQHDFYTATHMVNVGTWMTTLAGGMGVSDPQELAAVCTAGLLHDVGKMFVPEELLNKQGPLTADEWAVIREHPDRGVAHLRAQGVTDEYALRVTREHHERVDGSGYPQGLTGDRTHPVSRMCAVVDSFDAMTACRPFRNRVRTPAEALDILRAEAGTKYDPQVVAAWEDLFGPAARDRPAAGPAADPGLGRRRHERFRVDCPARACLLTRGAGGWEEGPPLSGRARNLSAGGVGLWLAAPAEPGAYVRVYLRGMGSLAHQVSEGQVVRCRPLADGGYDVGVCACPPGAQEAAAAKVLAA